MNLLFDVDGTLTEPMQKISPVMVLRLIGLVNKGYKVYIVAGSNLKQVEKQVGKRLLNKISGYFTSSAAEFHINGKRVYRLPKPKDKYPLEGLVYRAFKEFDRLSGLPHTKTRIEYRSGMINVCPVGREADKALRTAFGLYDAQNKWREQLVKDINSDGGRTGTTAVIGGQISIDVYYDGFQGKVKALKHVAGPSTYFGDKIYPGGNDYEIALACMTSNGQAMQINDGPKELLEHLKRMYIRNMLNGGRI